VAQRKGENRLVRVTHLFVMSYDEFRLNRLTGLLGLLFGMTGTVLGVLQPPMPGIPSQSDWKKPVASSEAANKLPLL
jgi:hypothetical protein